MFSSFKKKKPVQNSGPWGPNSEWYNKKKIAKLDLEFGCPETEF